MTAGSAYHPARAPLFDDIARLWPMLGEERPAPGMFDGVTARLAQEPGLPRALQAMVVSITRLGKLDAQARDVMLSLVAALPAGGNPQAAVHRWMVRALDGEEGSLGACLAGGPLAAAVAAARALHARAAQGETVAGREWRAARAALAQPLPDPVGAQAREAVAASAWNLAEVPGAAGDIVAAWLDLMYQVANRETGWTAQDMALFTERMRERQEMPADQRDALPPDPLLPKLRDRNTLVEQKSIALRLALRDRLVAELDAERRHGN